MRLAVAAAVALAASGSPVLAQSAEDGQKVFTQCRACHQVGPAARNAVGPVLNGLFGRRAGVVEGYSYSAANKTSGIVWDEATFREYIRDPKARLPGTKMIFAGLKDARKVDDLIAYLRTVQDEPPKSN